jgi:hypothetical protein
MAKQPVRKKTAMDEWAIAAGSSLGRLVAKIDRLTARRSEITAEIQHYVKQAEGALKKAVAQETAAAPATARKRAAKKPAARKTARKTAAKSKKRV